jgi:hypothetical protein
MSLDYSPYNDWHPKPLEHHYRLASELAPLREKGILIIGSGNLVHNLGLIDFDTDAKPYDWAVKFDENVKRHLLNRNHEALLNYLEIGQEARYAVPTLDHYLPMIYAIALQLKDEALKFIHEGFQNGSVSMRAFRIGWRRNWSSLVHQYRGECLAFVVTFLNSDCEYVNAMFPSFHVDGNHVEIVKAWESSCEEAGYMHGCSSWCGNHRVHLKIFFG